MLMIGWSFIAGGFLLMLGSGCLIVAGATIRVQDQYESEDESSEPFGFNVVDGGVVDGGEPEWDEEV